MVSGAPSRLAVSTTAASPCEDTCQAGTIAYEDEAYSTARKRLKRAPAALFPPPEDVNKAAAAVCIGTASSGQAPDAPCALPAGVTVRRRRRNTTSTAASAHGPVMIDPAPAPANSLRRISNAYDCPVLSSPAQVPSFGAQPEHHRHSTAGGVTTSAASRAAGRASVAARPPSARLQLQLPAPARRASLAPTAAKQPAALPARSRQSISYFHRECVSACGCAFSDIVLTTVLRPGKAPGPRPASMHELE